jgi:hypothetical protein
MRKTGMRREQSQAYDIVFIASFSLMVVEIVAGRIVAPHVREEGRMRGFFISCLKKSCSKSSSSFLRSSSPTICRVDNLTVPNFR